MLELDNITKTFGDTRVLNGVSLTLDDGRIMSILGPSGGGKTTLLNIILGITDATGGRILVDGKDMTRVPMEKRGFNIVFQDYALFPNLTAYENIIYGLRNNPGVSTPDEIRELIALLGLEEHLNKHIDELSGGQKQRVARARTLVMKPRPRARMLAQPPATRSSEPAPTRSSTRWPSCRSCCPNWRRRGAAASAVQQSYVMFDSADGVTVDLRLQVLARGLQFGDFAEQFQFSRAFGHAGHAPARRGDAPHVSHVQKTGQQFGGVPGLGGARRTQLHGRRIGSARHAGPGDGPILI